MQAPEVKVTPDGIIGWPEFEKWAMRNIAIWNDSFRGCRSIGLAPEEYIKLVAYHLMLENRRMMDAEIKRMESTCAPLFR